jgi:deoxycytidylate deaminase
MTSIEDRRPSWDQVWLSIAAAIAARSTCFYPVGAAVIASDNRLLSVACNDQRHGQVVLDLPATDAALVSADFSRMRGGSLYLTAPPGARSVPLIVAAGITRVVYVQQPGTEPSTVDQLLQHQGVSVIYAALPECR